MCARVYLQQLYSLEFQTGNNLDAFPLGKCSLRSIHGTAGSNKKEQSGKTPSSLEETGENYAK